MAKVMIVDDDKTMVQLLRTLLELDGFEVVPGNGSPADRFLQLVASESPDIVLLDVHLADSDGLELLTKLRADPLLTHTPVVMTSGLDMSDECARLGANDFIQKPYPPDQLSSKLKRALAA